MDYIIADPHGIELGYLDFKSLDLDLGVDNDFEITLDLDAWQAHQYTYGYYFYAPSTEYGGIIEDIQTDTKAHTVKLMGYTWRGLLSQQIIEPPPRSAYYRVSGDANEIISTVIDHRFGDLYRADTAASGVQITYQFDRYCTVLDGLNKMLRTVDCRLDIQWVAGQVLLQAVPMIDHSEELEYSQDGQINFMIRDRRCGINHLICLGRGELAERTVLHLYVQEDGSIGDDQNYRGLDERVAVYDYPNAEDIRALREGGIKKLKESANYQELKMSIDDAAVALYDIVGGRDRVTGITMRQPVTQKILKIASGKETITYKVGD